MVVEGENTLKVRLVIPICDKAICGRLYDFYCTDSLYHDERINLLEKAFTIPFENKRIENENSEIQTHYPDLVITSNNFFYFEIASGKDKVKSNLWALLKGVKPKINTDLLIGVDSDIVNPYEGISANVFHFKFENNKWYYQTYIWECWRKCKADCCRKERLIEKYSLAFYSCGDILGSCCNKNNNRNRNFSARIIVDLAHMDFCPECFRSDIKRRNFAGTILRTINNHSFLIITTQICRDHTNILDKIQKFFERGKYKLIFQGDNTISSSNSQQNNPLETIKNYILSEQTIIALDKQSIDYEIIENWENPNSFEDERKLKQVDAFFIDFEISFNRGGENQNSSS